MLEGVEVLWEDTAFSNHDLSFRLCSGVFTFSSFSMSSRTIKSGLQLRCSPHFHEELDGIWSRGVMKGRNPLKEAKVISRLKGSRQVIAAPRGHAKSTNFTFKDTLHAVHNVCIGISGF